ncbi:MAG: glycosyltransferase family 4 protein [Deltaproteobacteria bacterium]
MTTTPAAKTNIMFVLPLFYDPTLPNFKDRFEFISDRCAGHIVAPSDMRADGARFGSFTYHGIPVIRNRAYKYAYQIVKIVSVGLKANRQARLDYILSADPLFNGLAASVLSFLTGARLIVEFNGDYSVVSEAARRDFGRWIRTNIFKALVNISLKRSYAVKFLNSGQIRIWGGRLGARKKALFHDFVPTHIFDQGRSTDGRYILFVGHPFHLKGVDILIKAFMRISDRFPGYRLKIIGHCPDKAERASYQALAGGNDLVEILNPMFYGELAGVIQGCTFLVLPSRSEAMGRVLIEAMACAKPVIGSNVGGIPEVIDDGRNGLLFEPGNDADLAWKMEMLLTDEALRARMGEAGAQTVRKKFSSVKYAERFYEMING